MRAMNTDVESKSTQRQYSPEQKGQAVRMVFALREELSTRRGKVKCVADQLGIGAESLRSGVAYVCFILDAFSRRIVGWRVAAHI